MSEKSQKSEKSEGDAVKKLPSRQEDFIEWLNEVLQRTEMMDYRYNIKGCGVWRAYGFKLRRYVFDIIRNLLESTEIPHEEYLFPLLIPKPQFMKEAEHVKGFEEEVFWVTHGGLETLEIPLALRPTSETAMYPMFALWIRSYTDLPLKTYQLVNTFRYETKNTRPLIRVREITSFKEAHTVHATAEDAEKQIIEGVQVYKQFFESLGLSFIINKRPKWDTFPGAEYTIAFDAIFPGKRRTLQIGTVHNLGQTFAKTFEIRFENENHENVYAYQTCYGISERVIAAVVSLHGDDQGLILPPNIAPIQIVIIPIYFKDAADTKIIDECKRIKDLLTKNGMRVTLDETKGKPGSKFYFWEQKGVPLRIEIGPKDLEKNQVVMSRRDKKEKTMQSKADDTVLVNKIKDLFNNIENDMRKKVAETTKESILQTDNLDEAIEWVEQGKGVAEIPFCGCEECAKEVEKRTESLKFLGVPARYLPFLKHSKTPNKFGEMNTQIPAKKEIFCINCSTKVTEYWTIGRSF
jgi:prolyl-tRNA synthetase